LDTLTLYVPALSSHLNRMIDPGSAIVGEALDTGRIAICFEGNRFGFMRDWNEMVLHAADRLVTRYPTVARAWVIPSDLVPVGIVDRDTRTIVSITDEPALQAWRAG
jgi:hypothetical protein